MFSIKYSFFFSYFFLTHSFDHYANKQDGQKVVRDTPYFLIVISYNMRTYILLEHALIYLI